MKYKVGQLVRNKKLGLGKVLEVSGDEVIAYFKDEQVNPRTINVAVVPMEIPADQSDPFFDSSEGGNIAKLMKPAKAKRTPRKPKAAKVAARVEEADDDDE
jgi:hypothetical protein